MVDVFDTLYKGGTVVNQDGVIRCDIGVKDGKIASLGSFNPKQAGEVIDCTGLHILPGVIDSQVHFREPGLVHKEDLETGSRAAVMGGVTSVFEMPNTDPQTTNESALADKVKRATHRMHCDFAFWVGGTHENPKHIPDLEQLPGAVGIKVFMGSSTGSLLVEDDHGVAEILKHTKRRSAFHSEDEMLLRERKDLRVEGNPSSHPVWRSVEVAVRSTERLIRIAEDNRAKIHVLHISTAEEIVLLQDHKEFVSCEVTPQHLTFAAPDCYTAFGTLVQMNPPIRDAVHRDGLWRGVVDGVADVLGSDHAPHTLEEKAKIYPASPSGMTGVQTLVPVMLDHVSAGRMTIERFVDMTSAGPARLFGIANKGRIAGGYDADFTIVDLARKETISNRWIESRCGWTPYDGLTVTGWPVGTIIRGARVMWQGELVTPSRGEVVKFI